MHINVNTPTSKAIAALREPDASLARVPNAVRQSLADLIAQQAHRIDAFGLALMMIREGCDDPRGLAAKALAAESGPLPA